MVYKQVFRSESYVSTTIYRPSKLQILTDNYGNFISMSGYGFILFFIYRLKMLLRIPFDGNTIDKEVEILQVAMGIAPDTQGKIIVLLSIIKQEIIFRFCPKGPRTKATPRNTTKRIMALKKLDVCCDCGIGSYHDGWWTTAITVLFFNKYLCQSFDSKCPIKLPINWLLDKRLRRNRGSNPGPLHYE